MFSPTFFSLLCFHTSTHLLHPLVHRHLPRCGSNSQKWKQNLLPPIQNAIVLLQLTHSYFNTSNKFYKTLTPVSPYFYTHPTHKICNTSPLSSSKSTTASSSPQHKKPSSCWKSSRVSAQLYFCAMLEVWKMCWYLPEGCLCWTWCALPARAPQLRMPRLSCVLLPKRSL